MKLPAGYAATRVRWFAKLRDYWAGRSSAVAVCILRWPYGRAASWTHL